MSSDDTYDADMREYIAQSLKEGVNMEDVEQLRQAVLTHINDALLFEKALSEFTESPSVETYQTAQDAESSMRYVLDPDFGEVEDRMMQFDDAARTQAQRDTLQAEGAAAREALGI
ncbi:hypothetical protein [Rhodococcus sp. 008]|uniref:hypothetical protein n=1 Tax=Rhodococcus sp. 008 TaxID=1723645 RepID=UPI0008064084|nr:hypothetical protein [Rhodococcus sp. 008]ANQ69427.1 hypothetical protein AOT96_00015 [Rhodococcus sp. 008]